MASKIRWTNPAQPQTLVIAVFLLYLNAVFEFFYLLTGVRIYTTGVALLVIAAQVLGGWGIANERKWGYWLGLGAAIAPFLYRYFVYNVIFAGVNVLTLMFEVALVALLLHPQSRTYQREWFK